jgi:leader peptidase (prepilin peptidase)/N-methyltransferase
MWHSAVVIHAVVFLFGLAVGSFLNVCIRRLPKEMSVIRPASHCPACQAPIKPYDNIPLVSYVLLGGRCRACRAPISPVYPAVELLTALLFLACYAAFGATAEAAKWAAFCALLVVLVFTDFFDRLLPDAVTLPGLAAGLLFSLIVAPWDGSTLGLLAWAMAEPPAPVVALSEAVMGAALGGGLLFVVAEGYLRLRGREGMGLGDVKMMAMAGAFLGPKRALLTILAGSLLGSLFGAACIGALYARGWKRAVAERAARRGRGDVRRLRWVLAGRYPLPFGSFLGIAALLVLFFGSPLLDWYRELFAR